MQYRRKHHKDSYHQERSQQIAGLDAFHKSLDKIFFSNSIVTYKRGADQIFNLIIDLNCNFNLINALFHPNMANWGRFHNIQKCVEQPPFERAFMKLQDLNQGAVDIAEVYINLLDTSLIISNTHDQSLSHQLEAILLSLSENFVHFTKGLLEIPFEIFIPVFEKKESNSIPSSRQLEQQTTGKGGYFDFWGLYFPSKKNQDPIIYDLKHKRFIDGDLLLRGLEK